MNLNSVITQLGEKLNTCQTKQQEAGAYQVALLFYVTFWCLLVFIYSVEYRLQTTDYRLQTTDYRLQTIV